MRPHNSGHWTIEGARTSQFEQHLRAVLDYPLGDDRADRPGGGDGQRARRRSPAASAIDERLHHLFAADPGVKVHLYGKQVRPGRKIGHVTALGDDLATRTGAGARAAAATGWLTARVTA